MLSVAVNMRVWSYFPTW